MNYQATCSSGWHGSWTNCGVGVFIFMGHWTCHKYAADNVLHVSIWLSIIFKLQLKSCFLEYCYCVLIIILLFVMSLICIVFIYLITLAVINNWPEPYIKWPINYCDVNYSLLMNMRYRNKGAWVIRAEQENFIAEQLQAQSTL